MQDDVKALAKKVKRSLHDLEDVTKENYDALVSTIVDEYAAKKEMAIDAKDSVVQALRDQWHAMEAEYQDLKK